MTRDAARDVVLAPSDVLGVIAEPRPSGSVLVGGRVVEQQGRSLRLADAFATLVVELAAEAELAVGDLIVVAGRVDGDRLRDASLERRHPHPLPGASGEHARLAWQGVGPRLLARSRALGAIRAYFAEQRFVEVDTPLRVKMPGLDLHVDAIAAEGGFLVTSPEHQMKRLLTGGMPRIFQLCHTSRAGELGPLHEPEFLMLEWYRAFAGQDDVMSDTEQVVARVVEAVAGAPHVTLADGRRIDVAPPFERMSVRDAFRSFAGVSDAAALAEDCEDRFFELLVGAVEPALARLGRPVFLCGYPATQASLARRSPDDPRVAERFELYLAGVELCNGFGELTDAAEQRRRFERDQVERRRRGRPVYPIDERLLAALVEGMPPSGGNALGVDRLLALAAGVSEISRVQAFPAAWL